MEDDGGKEVENKLINETKKIFEETDVTIQTKKGYTKRFTMRKRVQQVC